MKYTKMMANIHLYDLYKFIKLSTRKSYNRISRYNLTIQSIILYIVLLIII